MVFVPSFVQSHGFVGDVLEQAGDKILTEGGKELFGEKTGEGIGLFLSRKNPVGMAFDAAVGGAGKCGEADEWDAQQRATKLFCRDLVLPACADQYPDRKRQLENEALRLRKELKRLNAADAAFWKDIDRETPEYNALEEERTSLHMRAAAYVRELDQFEELRQSELADLRALSAEMEAYYSNPTVLAANTVLQRVRAALIKHVQRFGTTLDKNALQYLDDNGELPDWWFEGTFGRWWWRQSWETADSSDCYRLKALKSQKAALWVPIQQKMDAYPMRESELKEFDKRLKTDWQQLQKDGAAYNRRSKQWAIKERPILKRGDELKKWRRDFALSFWKWSQEYDALKMMASDAAKCLEPLPLNPNSGKANSRDTSLYRSLLPCLGEKGFGCQPLDLRLEENLRDQLASLEERYNELGHTSVGLAMKWGLIGEINDLRERLMTKEQREERLNGEAVWRIKMDSVRH
jgi:hypothetical protein